MCDETSELRRRIGELEAMGVANEERRKKALAAAELAWSDAMNLYVSVPHADVGRAADARTMARTIGEVIRLLGGGV